MPSAKIGPIVALLFFIPLLQTKGIDLPRFISALFVNGAAGGFSADLLISSVIFWLFMFQRRCDVDGPNPALFILLNLTIGLSCALPAYLYANEK
ncbi:MAG: hypothetical protein ACI9XU_001731 [Arenicella sp.]